MKWFQNAEHVARMDDDMTEYMIIEEGQRERGYWNDRDIRGRIIFNCIFELGGTDWPDLNS
jgi:hypothetical protein